MYSPVKSVHKLFFLLFFLPIMYFCYTFAINPHSCVFSKNTSYNIAFYYLQA